MEAVEDHAQPRMIGLADQVPALLVGIDVPAPGQRFIANTQAADTGAFGQQPQVVDQKLPIAQCVRLTVAAHQHQISA